MVPISTDLDELSVFVVLNDVLGSFERSSKLRFRDVDGSDVFEKIDTTSVPSFKTDGVFIDGHFNFPIRLSKALIRFL